MTKSNRPVKVTQRSQKPASAAGFDPFYYTDDQRSRIVDLLNSVCPESGMPFRLPEDTKDRPTREVLSVAFEDPDIPVDTIGELFFAPIAFLANEAVKTFDAAAGKQRRKQLSESARQIGNVMNIVNDEALLPIFHLPDLAGLPDGRDREAATKFLVTLQNLMSAERKMPNLPKAAMDRNGVIDFLVMRTLEIHDALSGKSGGFSVGNRRDKLIELVETVVDPVLGHLGLEPVRAEYRIRSLRQRLPKRS